MVKTPHIWKESSYSYCKIHQMNKALYLPKHLCTCFVLIYSFIYFGYKPRNETSGSYSTAMFNCLRNGQNVFQNGVAILHSLQQSMNVPISPHSNQKLW